MLYLGPIIRFLMLGRVVFVLKPMFGTLGEGMVPRVVPKGLPGVVSVRLVSYGRIGHSKLRGW